MKNKWNIIFFLLSVSFLISNELYNQSFRLYSNDINNLKNNKIISDNNEGFIVNGNNKLIPMISSAIIPGSGQYFINGDKKKGMLFFGLELAAWAGYFFYKNKAENYKNDYQDYGDEHWDIDTWINHYYDWSAPDNEFFEIFANSESGYPDINEGSHHIDFYYTDDYGNQIFVRTNSDDFFDMAENWNSLNIDDETIIKDHHFYENIVKYNHFFAGWDDQDEIEMQINNNGYKTAFSPNKFSYRNLYNKSIDNYKIKDNIVSFIFINHFVSMLDGLISGRSSSKDVSFLYDYDSIINFHEAKLIIKLK